MCGGRGGKFLSCPKAATNIAPLKERKKKKTRFVA
jgi:hypothetical protein